MTRESSYNIHVSLQSFAGEMSLEHKNYNWKIFWILFGAALVGVLAVMPYLITLIQTLPVDKPIPFSLPVLLLLSFLQSAVLLAAAVGVGLLLAWKIGKGVPLLESWLAGERVGPELRVVLRSAVPAGVGVGLVLLLLLHYVFVPLEPKLIIIHASNVAIWKKFLASFYGGINEELLMRLFLLSLLFWSLNKIRRGVGKSHDAKSFWIANVMLAVLFGLGHLGTASIMLPITPIVFLAAIALNGIASLAFGYLYWTRGLEAAMLAHFSTDIVFHVIGSALFRT
jgi:membrane protease YdiL (CAAX protease family)